MDLEGLALSLGDLRAEGKRVVLCHGVFDLLHIGHIRHLQEAKRQGDVLVVTITPDRFVNKGPNRPAFTENLRAEAIGALGFVDFVAINESATAVRPIELLKPHIYAKGKEYHDQEADITGGIVEELHALEGVQGKMIFTDDVTFSSSTLLNQHFPVLSEEMRQYMKGFKERFSTEDVRGFIQNLRKQKVLLVGETIIDDYHYCRAMGKSGKEPILVVAYEKQEQFAGGILAVANGVADICDEVKVLSFLGKDESYEGFVRDRIDKKIQASFLTMDKGPTIVKRRYIESYPFQKMFEVYVMGNDEGCSKDSRALCERLDEVIDDFDLVIVVDYGHGMLSPEAVDLLCERSKFLAVNTQINAGNHGFNTISKYKRADFVCLSENEIRMDARTKERDLSEIIQEVSRRLQADSVLVTRGKNGCTCFRKGEGLYEIPAFMGQAVDRIGAGDAVLALAALLVEGKVPMEAVGLIGNAMGLQAVQTVGHRDTPQHVALLKFLEHSMK